MKTALALLLFLKFVKCWESEQLEVFDVVEEVNENFYELLNIPQNATSSDIRSAFRKLSVVLHPDKNLNEDTSEKFRNLVSVYEVLKDPKKRNYYDDVLVNGMPNWKSAMYYYRRVRKMGILEGSVIVFCIFTIGQYLVAWAAYFEHVYNENMQKSKKQKKNIQKTDPPKLDVPKPSVLNTLPFQIPSLLYFMIVSTPRTILFCKELLQEKFTANEVEEESEEEEIVQKPKVRRRKPRFEMPEGPTFEQKQTKNENQTQHESAPAPISGGLWTDDDLDNLVQLVKKYPGGTPKRWEVIAEAIGRSVAEVTYMANKVKENAYKLPSHEEDVAVEEKTKQKTKGGKLATNDVKETTWSQNQQKALEDALAKYPKGSSERWERIAEAVPEKSKEECMLRYKHLVETIKKQKEQ